MIFGLVPTVWKFAACAGSLVRGFGASAAHERIFDELPTRRFVVCVCVMIYSAVNWLESLKYALMT